jgi:integrase
VPLGAPVLDLLAHAARVAGNPYVCPGERPGAPLVGIDKAWARLCLGAGLVGVRIHDLRHYPERRIIPSRPPLQRTSAHTWGLQPRMVAG